jgi:hypothetical protein
MKFNYLKNWIEIKKAKNQYKKEAKKGVRFNLLFINNHKFLMRLGVSFKNKIRLHTNILHS